MTIEHFEFDEQEAIKQVDVLMKTAKAVQKNQEKKIPSDLKYYWQRELSQKEINTARDLHITLKAQLLNQLDYTEKTLSELDKLQKEIDTKSKNISLTKYSDRDNNGKT